MKFSLRKRKGSPYYMLDASVRLQDGTRKRVRKSVEAKDYSTAKLKAKLLLRQLEGNPDGETVTLSEFYEEYLSHSEKTKGRTTFLNERSILKRVRDLYPSLSLNEFTPRLADKFISGLTEGKSPASVNSYIRMLKAIFNTAIRWNYISTNPFIGAKRMLVQLEPPRVLSAREISSLMTTTQHHYPHLFPVWEFFLGTGLRRSELIRLSSADFDFERNIIIVRGKRKKLRWVPMLPQARKVALQRVEHVRPFSFTGEYLTKKYQKIANIAGIKNTSLHDLRRAYGSYLLHRGVARETVMKLLGHDSFGTTDTFYFGISEDIITQISGMNFPN